MAIEVRYEGRTVRMASGETVLDGLERAGLAVPSSCRAGACQFCVMRVTEGPIPPGSQDGLKDSLKNSSHFLTCIARPQHSFSCEPAHVARFRGTAAIEEVRIIGAEIALVRFRRPETFDFTAGQFVTMRRDDGMSRSYSLASRTDERRYFDIHVKRVTNGRMSSWLYGAARPGDELYIEGPKGECVFYPDSVGDDLVLAGTGTGIAPLFAIADDAIRRGYAGRISIFQGAVASDSLYFVEELQELAATAANVSYTRCVLRGTAAEGVVVGDLRQVVLAAAGNARGKRVYLCGEANLVRDLKRKLFLQGASLRKIHADPFIGTD